MALQRINKRTPLPKTTDGQRPVYAGDVNTVIDKVNEIETDMTTLQSDVTTLQSEIGGETVTTGITAYAGGGQANATQLDYGWNEITVVASTNDSVKLPNAVQGKKCIVNNSDGGTIAKIFPKTGETLSGLNENDGTPIQPLTYIEFFCKVTEVWTAV